MFRVNDCCCGYSLRIGTKVLLWYTVVIPCLNNLLFLKIFNNIGKDGRSLGIFPNEYILFVYIAINEIALIIGILGLYGIQKNKAKYVTPFLYFFGFVCIGSYAFILLNISLFFIEEYRERSDTGTIAFGTISATAMITYYFIVIKNYRDSMLEEPADYNGIAQAAPCATPTM